MKTAATAQRAPSAPEAAKGGGARKPFFTAPVQAKLAMGRPGDRFEVEADRSADRVVAGVPAGANLAADLTPVAQRREAEEEKPEAQAKAAMEEEKEPEAQAKAEEEEKEPEAQAKEEDEQPEAQAKAEDEEPEAQAKAEEEEKEPSVQAKEEEEKEPEAQRKEEEDKEPEAQAKEKEEEERGEGAAQARGGSGGAGAMTEDLSRQIAADRGRGNALADPVRDKMSAAFGADFSGVRIHTDAAAVLLARSLNAQAFTVGSDIFFGEGKYSPDSRSGQHLLAHELAHTVQQGAAEPAPPNADIIRLSPDAGAEDSYDVRPEILEAVRLARGEIGKVNAKVAGGDGRRVGADRLREYFLTAFGGPVISEKVIDRLTLVEMTNADGSKTRKDALPSWCGIFTWWAMKKAGIPIPDWKLGAPALDAMKLRPQGSLPRKGDIAIDVVPNNHFAMVTGVESTADAEGKPVKMTRVATINGNTAGEDNLGGQVQEKWDTVSRWDHFLDPVGKMALPDVPMVRVSRAPSEAEEAAPGPEAAAAAEAAAAEASASAEAEAAQEAKLDELDAPVTPPEPVAFTDVPPGADLTLPPRGDGGPAEAVAKVEKVEMGGTSDEATAAYIDAGPSAMAVSQPDLGPAIDGKMKGEQADLAAAPPVLAVKTSGAADAPLGTPSDIPIPGEVPISDGVTAPDPGAIDPVSAPSPEPFRGNSERAKELEKEESGSFWDAFKSFLTGFLKGIKTRDDSIGTRAGPRQKVALEGEADAGRMDAQRKDGTAALAGQRDAAVDAFRNHPGQSNIQPKKVDEARPAPVSAEPAAEIAPQDDPAVRDYAEAPLPEDVRAAGDAKIAAKMAPGLADARAQATDAAATRDTEKGAAVDAAQRDAAKINEDADAKQRGIVIDNRKEVAGLQKEGIGGAYDQVNAFSKEAADQQTANRKEIGDHVRTQEGKAKTELDQGEKDAEAKKADGEKQAADKKKEIEKDQEEGSWWDRAKDAIKKAVKAVTEAIDAVFTAVRNAVKTIIEKAKNAAIGLINAARTWVVDKLNSFRDWAKTQVDKYLKDAFPGLAKRINAGIDAVANAAIAGVNAVADAAVEAVTALADGLAAALDKVLAVFQTALKTAVRVLGAVMQGDFAEALRAAIEGACEIAGVDPKTVFNFLDRAGKAITSILKDPVKFIKGLFGAVGDGIAGFFKNIKTHLIEGVVRWLTGALSEVNLSGPFEFSPKGILKLVLEILGLTYANIKARVIKKLPAAAKVFSVVEKSFALVHKLVTEGPAALWEEIKSQLSSLKETVMGAIRNWLITTVIKEGIVWLLSLTNPASAIVKAVKLLFDLVMFLVERYQQIKDFVLSVYEAVAAIAAGNFAKVTSAVEGALARLLPVLISLLASILGLGGISKQVKKVIETVTKPINKAIDFVVDKIVKFAKKVIGKVKAGVKKAKDKAKDVAAKVLSWWKTKSGFKDKSGHDHTLSYKGSKKAASLHVASSNPIQISAFLTDRAAKAKAGGTKYSLADVQAAQAYYKTNVAPAEAKLKAADTGGAAAKQAKAIDANKAVADDLQKHLDHIGITWLARFFDDSDEFDFPPPQLPVMADNVKARTCEADYLVRSSKYKHETKTGTESGEHVGNLHGWPDLQGAKLTSGSAKYVRMHLLPHKLGGDAVDSNLTPARGDLFNTPFSAAVEQPAIKSATEGDEAARKPIWYRFEIDYYPASTPPPAVWTPGVPYPADAFPKSITARWGFYKARSSDSPAIERGPAVKEKTDTPKLPDLAVVPPAINKDGPTALLHALRKQDPAITMYFVTEILIPNREYGSKTQMKNALWQKFGGVTEAVRRQYVKATYDAVGTHVTLHPV
jgi:phage-related protein